MSANIRTAATSPAPHRTPESDLNTSEELAGVVSVDKGDALLVLESMKMQIPILSELRGTVVSIEVRPAETVQRGKLLVVVRPAE